MSFYHSKKLWKITFIPKVMSGGMRGVALVEAADHHDAMYTFSQQYAGEYSTIQTCTEL